MVKSLLIVCVVLLSLPCVTLAVDCPLPDTGQTKCYDIFDNEIYPCPQPGEPFYGQDASYAPCNPHSYTKLDANGNDLPDDAPSWVMVRDNVTRLIWEVKKDDGSIHDKDDAYDWNDVHGVFIATLNSQNFGGHSDWRLPSIKELSTIVDSSKSDPAINTDYFPNNRSYIYWSSTEHVLFGAVWFIIFNIGETGFYYSDFYVRAVRGGQCGLSDNFVDNGNGTISDTNTGLMWQKETAQGTYTWEQAFSYCENLTLAGYDDWRLPNRNELQSLVDYSQYNPSIDTTFFPNTLIDRYWSSTKYTTTSYSAWFIVFNFGSVMPYYTSSSYYVRAVRGGQCNEDWDKDGILGDGDNSGTSGDNPCTGGQTENCDDNCPNTPNPDQTDSYPEGGNGCGDACECEGNFNPEVDDDVDGSDAAIFKTDFGRGGYDSPCTGSEPCNGDFDCDTDVDGSDASLFKSDYGRSLYNSPCPACEVGEWCNYSEPPSTTTTMPITTTSTVPATTTTSSPITTTTTTNPLACELAISPTSATVYTWESIQFSTTLNGECNTPCNNWEVLSSIGSTIDSNGLYTAGDTAGSDTVTVTDNCNMDISDSAYVNVLTPTTITTTIAP